MRQARVLCLLPLTIAFAFFACGASNGDERPSDPRCLAAACKLAPPPGQVEGFGAAIASEGNRMVVGSKVGDPTTQAGAAFIYEFIDGEWMLRQTIQATVDTSRAGDLFGGAVAIEGGRIAVGAPGAGWDDPNDTDTKLNIERVGDVLIFEPDANGRWLQVQRIHALDRSQDDGFGISVAMDGDWLIIGSHLDDDGGSDSGSVYAYRHNGTQFVLDQKIHMTQNSPNDRFGFKVAIDGDILLASAYWDSYYSIGQQTGSVAVFRRNGDAWIQQQVLLGGTRSKFDQFGFSIDLDDEVIVVGAHQYDGEFQDQGVVWVFRIIAPEDSHPWNTGDDVVRIEPKETAAGLRFGTSVAIEDGRVIVGSLGGATGQLHAGAVHVFRDNGGEWVQEEVLIAPDGSARGRFGAAAVLSGESVIVGAPGTGPGKEAPGAVYGFRLRE